MPECSRAIDEAQRAAEVGRSLGECAEITPPERCGADLLAP